MRNRSEAALNWWNSLPQLSTIVDGYSPPGREQGKLVKIEVV
jgi:hypothetical protein